MIFWIPAVLFAADVLLLNQGLLSLLAALGALFFIVVQGLLVFRHRTAAEVEEEHEEEHEGPPRWGTPRERRRLVVAAAWLGFGLAGLAANRLNNALAADRAERVIGACERYQAKHGRLPERLEQITPDFLASVPRAKYTLVFGRFQYLSEKGGHWLVWTVLPPYGRQAYSFEEERWRFLD